ncbi:hypothetical protein [Clostridium culturomicium]|uniref:hypothetical protein n=1 Tax=Clostridium culturomicium TaxID=1499683 RepID=UPI003857E92A
MNSIICSIFIIAMIVDVILNLRVIYSNKKRNDSIKNLIEIDKKLREDLANHRMEHRFRNDEVGILNRKLDTVNRKLTILNKANYKKY